MANQLHLNLQQRAALSFATSFWERKEIKDRVIEFFGPHHKFKSSQDQYSWQRLTKEALKEWNKNILPPKLEVELIHIVNEIGKRIFNWHKYIEYENESKRAVKDDVIDYINKLYWTPHGTVDEVKMFKAFWFDNPDIDVIKLYNIACKYVLKKDIDKLWQKIPLDQRIIHDNNISQCYNRVILAYWKYIRDGDMSDFLQNFETDANLFKMQYPFHRLQYYNLNRSTEENMFRLSVDHGHSTAAMYFWEKLTEEERNRNVLICACITVVRFDCCGPEDFIREKYIEMCIFLMNQMTTDQKRLFFDKDSIWDTENDFCIGKFDRKGLIIKMLLSAWPWQEFFAPVLSDMMEYLEHDTETACLFLDDIAQRIVTDHGLGYVVKNSKYQSLLHSAWFILPGIIKQKIIKENLLLNFISRLFHARDLDSIKLIFNDPEIESVKDLYIESGKWGYNELIVDDKLEVLDQFMEAVFRSDEEKKCFKQKISLPDTLITRNQFHLADKLLDWQCGTPEERQCFKSKIDPIKICKYFINDGQYDLVEKFLNWRFEVEEEKKMCKDHFKSVDFSIKWIYKIWNIGEMNICRAKKSSYRFRYIDEAKKKSSQFLEWIFETKDEIENFKKEIFLNSLEQKLFINYCDKHNLNFIKGEFSSWCLSTKE